MNLVTFLKIRINIIKAQYQSTHPLLQVTGACRHGSPPARPGNLKVCAEQAPGPEEEGRPPSHRPDPGGTPPPSW